VGHGLYQQCKVKRGRKCYCNRENGEDCVVVEVVDLEEARICLSIEIFRSSDFWMENDFYFSIYL